MTDVFSRRKRSEVMSRIRGRGNESTEIRFVRMLRAKRITGWRRHVELSLGDVGEKDSGVRRRRIVRPDFVFRRERVSVFIDGCFWHGCPEHARLPATRTAYWMAKLAGNRSRDSYVTAKLRRCGWMVIRIWEHQLRSEEQLVRLIKAAVCGKHQNRTVKPVGSRTRSRTGDQGASYANE